MPYALCSMHVLRRSVLKDALWRANKSYTHLPLALLYDEFKETPNGSPFSGPACLGSSVPLNAEALKLLNGPRVNVLGRDQSVGCIGRAV